MKIKILFLTFCLFGLTNNSFSQFSSYLSSGYGLMSNPLYSYEMKPSMASQTYLEINNVIPINNNLLNFQYVGSLLLLNKISERNYYEHRLGSNYSLIFGKKPILSIQKQNEEDESEEDSTTVDENTEEESEPIENKFDDSTLSYLNIGAMMSSRINKTAFNEFDNWSVGFNASYRFMPLEEYYLKLSNEFNNRKYNIVTVLSNQTNLFSLTLGNKTSLSTNYGLTLSFGIKHFTEKLSDTTYIEELDSFVVEKQADNLLQFSPILFLSQKIDDVSIDCKIKYYFNLQNKARFIAQNGLSKYVNEDLYNDSFSSEGTGFELNFKDKLFWNIILAAGFDFQQRKFGYSAYDLEQNIVADKRKDLRSNIELSLSRYFEINDNLGVDFTFSSGYTRNQSNDNFNNYYLYYYMVAVGIGF